ncbi:hypothetical protein ACFL10_01270 [Patescibacteria group bacterium]
METMGTDVDLQAQPETSDKMRILLCNDDDASYSLIVWPGENLPKCFEGIVEQVIEVDFESSDHSKILEAFRLISSVDMGDSIHGIFTAIVNSVWKKAKKASQVE